VSSVSILEFFLQLNQDHLSHGPSVLELVTPGCTWTMVVTKHREQNPESQILNSEECLELNSEMILAWRKSLKQTCISTTSSLWCRQRPRWFLGCPEASLLLSWCNTFGFFSLVLTSIATTPSLNAPLHVSFSGFNFEFFKSFCSAPFFSLLFL
jgi:hypothetical protein